MYPPDGDGQLEIIYSHYRTDPVELAGKRKQDGWVRARLVPHCRCRITGPSNISGRVWIDIRDPQRRPDSEAGSRNPHKMSIPAGKKWPISKKNSAPI